MNIKNRLKKIENQIIKPYSEFCSCPRTTVTFLILPTIDEKPQETKQPEICPDCQKPVEMREIKPATFNIFTNAMPSEA